MLNIRKAQAEDKDAILKILKEADIYYPALVFKNFFAAKKDGRVLGCAQLEEHPDFFYLGSLAVTTSHTSKGVAKKILNVILKDLKKDIYLYTTIPEFFKKFSFVITSPRPDLPSKDRYECADCHSERCVCMVKHAKRPK